MIRKITINDFEEVKNIFNEVHNLHYKNRPDIYNDGEVLNKEIFSSIINNKDNLNYAYTIDNKIVGILFAEIKHIQKSEITKERKICFIENLAVKKNYQRQGIARYLYDNLKNAIKDKNINAIELNVWAFNKNAIKFYKSLGMNIKNMKYEEII